MVDLNAGKGSDAIAVIYKSRNIIKIILKKKSEKKEILSSKYKRTSTTQNQGREILKPNRRYQGSGPHITGHAFWNLWSKIHRSVGLPTPKHDTDNGHTDNGHKDSGRQTADTRTADSGQTYICSDQYN